MSTPRALLFGIVLFGIVLFRFGMPRGAESPRTSIRDLVVFSTVLNFVAVAWGLVARDARAHRGAGMEQL